MIPHLNEPALIHATLLVLSLHKLHGLDCISCLSVRENVRLAVGSVHRGQRNVIKKKVAMTTRMELGL
jgi:hypothetical protein